ncbi:TIGR00255 family protein [Granulicella rosea]|uniref:TIGR00255 family protein n=1 Tax=Granulicella rosea TaxID=474952 RepID=A0A239EHL9_9BACT|nr:YicC/YloC family endoribonuclease [Granulicella rosea]SNS43921.1 TIGR00255 family protein [Granulicella rosea]
MSENSVLSMTGYATVQGCVPETGDGFSLTLKSVNHRHFDLQLRLPGGLDALEAELRRAIRAHVRRGHIEFTLSFDARPEGKPAVQLSLDEPTLAAYLAAFKHASHLHRLTADPNLHELLRMPGVMTVAADAAPGRRNPAEVSTAVMATLDGLFEAYQAVRAAEGAALAAELKASLARVSAMVEEASELRASVTQRQFERLKARMAELLVETAIPEEKLLAEAALLAERGDVEEELVRLRTHVARFAALLDAGGETGKPLDFLLQELNREANTLLSKTGGAAGEAGLRITELGLAMKLEFERAREQVQNLE